jgi:hypothetical protein
MIYEETYIRNLLKCNQCEVKFDDYEQPRSLPCGKIICSLCVSKIEKEAVKSKLKCICSVEHLVPKEKRRFWNKRISSSFTFIKSIRNVAW